MAKQVILTGIRANGELHLGTYLGAILPMVRLQDKYITEKSDAYQLNFFVPDLHSITTPVDHGSLQDNIMTNLRMYVAAGIDIASPNIYLYQQSYIPAHSELAWILNCFTYYGEAQRMVEFKDKSKQLGNESVSLGLFNYPVLMAADILLYNATWVPVGEDQRQHLELTRTIAERINNKFGEAIFTVPKPGDEQITFAGLERPVRIRSLRNPDKKMSKSISDPAGTILLTDSPNEAVKKVMSATTDSIGAIAFDFDKQPGISNLLQILALLTDTKQSVVNEQWAGKSSYGELKTAVADAVKSFLTDFQSKLSTVTETMVHDKMVESEKELITTAQETLKRTQKAVGLR